MTCLWCNGYIPLPETWGEQTFCTSCSRPYIGTERTEIWYDTYWEKYEPVKDDDD